MTENRQSWDVQKWTDWGDRSHWRLHARTEGMTRDEAIAWLSGLRDGSGIFPKGSTAGLPQYERAALAARKERLRLRPSSEHCPRHNNPDPHDRE